VNRQSRNVRAIAAVLKVKSVNVKSASAKKVKFANVKTAIMIANASLNVKNIKILLKVNVPTKKIGNSQKKVAAVRNRKPVLHLS
jgi:hypothetical protein